jgi:5-(carboxyamino)imidazole ribonucleotide mutase
MTTSNASSPPLVSIIMGSQSDWPTMQHAADLLTELDVPFETRIVSAHRTPTRLYDFARGAAERGIQAL